MSRHRRGMSSSSLAAWAVVLIILGGCLLVVTLREGEALVKWLKWIFGL